MLSKEWPMLCRRVIQSGPVTLWQNRAILHQAISKNRLHHGHTAVFGRPRAVSLHPANNHVNTWENFAEPLCSRHHADLTLCVCVFHQHAFKSEHRLIRNQAM